jgi:poly-gamma-glutamate capsule biosynthesis protein CapA/YwtB (metallophosphatase superfamily)
MVYRDRDRQHRRGYRHLYRKLLFTAIGIVLAVGAIGAYKHFTPTSVEKAANQLQFDTSVSDAEKQAIRQAIRDQSKTYDGSVKVRIQTGLEATSGPSILSAYVPVTNVYATRLAVTKDQLSGLEVYVPSDIDAKAKAAIAAALDLDEGKLLALNASPDKLSDNAVAFIPADQLAPNLKLLAFDGAYYLDSLAKGAVFRQAIFSGKSAASLNSLALNKYATKETTLKVNMTGVTALTRVMMKKLSSVKDPTYFSKQIGSFLADADITHVSNEVSFRTGCPYSDVAFCSPPEMIETLKASGVDLVELTGNHNNDTGNQYNTESINTYHGLGWHTFGGGLNTAEAGKLYLADQKGSKIAFLGYNYADAPASGAIATTSTAGANHFDFAKIKTDIAAAKQQSKFIIIDIQFWECYAYPDGFVEFPECDRPIADQTSVFRQLIDMGADMVIGTQAHQPQTYELYKGKPIYYGLGNLYFEQTQWPGTERGIILTHYFVDGTLVQTRLSPTVYDKDLQTHLMTNTDAVALLQRLKTARQAAGL